MSTMYIFHLSALFALITLIVSTNGNSVPKRIRKMNKALGIPKNSEALWDILDIPVNTGDIANLEMRVNGLESLNNLTCIGQVNLAGYPQWADEDGYWLGEYTFMDGNGDPLYDPNYWNYPYDHYKGFIAGSVDGGSYSQRNVFLYPPQTVERCALDDQVSFDGDICGLNGGIKRFQADQTTEKCDPMKPGAISGLYNGKNTTTELIGAGNALLYQVFNNVNGVDTLEHSQLTTLTTLADGSKHRTRTAQLFDRDTMTEGVSGPPYRASFYRERKVSKEEFYQALDNQLATYNVSDQAIGDICYGSDRNTSVTNLLLFLEGGRTWPVGDKYECPTRPPKSNYCWTQGGVDGGSGYFPGIQVGDLVTESQRAAAAGFGGDDAMVEIGWWKATSLFWTQVGVDGGSGYFPGIQAGDLVTESQRATAAGFGGDEAMIELGWWEELCE